MCLITIKPCGADLPKDDYLENGERTNKDGIGCAYWKAGTNEVVIKKDFKNIEEFIKWEKENITKEDSMLIHFRLATSGLKDEGNRHPFPLTKNGELIREVNLTCDSALVHNGVLSDLGGHKTFSDTQKFIMDIIADDAIKNNLESTAIRKLIIEFIGNDRLAILLKTGEIYIFGEYEKDDGLLFSNTSYKKYVQRYGGGAGFGWQQGEFFRRNLPNHYKEEEEKEEEAKSTLVDEGYVDECDGCKKKTFIRYFETEGEDEYYYFCKKCRRASRKGKLEIEGVKIVPRGTNSSVGDVKQRCGLCGEWTNEEDLEHYEEMVLCPNCYTRFAYMG